MKLRFKIILVCITVILLALLCGNLLIYYVCSDVILDEAQQAAYIESEELRKSFVSYLSSLKTEAGEPEIRYFFQRNGDYHSIAVKDGKDFYNNTILTLDDLERGTYYNSQLLNLKRHEVAGRNVFIYRFHCPDYTIYHLVDVTHVYDKLNVITWFMAIISAGVIAVSAGILFFALKKMLSPLKELSDAARSISNGAYENRVTVRTRDEIGVLAGDFNTMAEAVELHTQALKNSEQKKTMFMGNLTHELKTPLTAIMGYAQTLRTVELSEADKKESLTYIYEESKRLDRLSKKMMRLLELDRETEISLEEISVQDLFADAIKTCQRNAEQRKVKIETVSCDGTIMGDPDLMCDVIVNLVDNGIKASQEGASVLLGYEKNRITVQDFGCGIPAEEIPKITEPFYMVDKSRSRQKGGSGLGLALTRLILDHHGMTLYVESTVGKGTKMIIEMGKE